MTPDQIKDQFHAHIEAIADDAQDEARRLARIADELFDRYIDAGGGIEMLEAVSGVMAHEIAQSSMALEARAQDELTGAFKMAFRFLVAVVA